MVSFTDQVFYSSERVSMQLYQVVKLCAGINRNPCEGQESTCLLVPAKASVRSRNNVCVIQAELGLGLPRPRDQSVYRGICSAEVEFG